MAGLAGPEETGVVRIGLQEAGAETVTIGPVTIAEVVDTALASLAT